LLFKKTDTVLQYAELTSGIQFNSIRSTINLVEQQHIAPVLGSTLFNSLNTAYTAAADETALNADQQNLLEKCRWVIGPMLCYYYAPKSEVKLGESGAQRVESDTNKTAYQNQVVNYREQNLREGELATELLLQFLDENQTKYTAWVDSPGFQKYKELFIKSGSEFQDLFTSHSPYRNYLAMRGKMQDVEQNNIRPLLGDDLFNHLKELDQSEEEFSENEEALLKKIKKVIAYLTVASAIPFLNVRMDANGITVMNNSSAQNDQMAKRSAAPDTILNSVISACNDAAKSWINNVTTFLAANPEDFAEYLPDPLVTGTQTQPQIKGSQPECLNGSFGLI